MKCIKVSFSLPKDLWDFIENEKTATGRRGTSHVIQDAIDMLRKSRARSDKYRRSLVACRQKEVITKRSRPGAIPSPRSK